MIFTLSPAKTLDYETPLADLPPVTATEPRFGRQSAELARLLKKRSAREIGELMGVSDALADLNVARFRAWRAKPDEAAARPAVLAFDGDVYDGLEARSLTRADLAWAQDHVRILSGLYGVLRPFDALQPYRLEMGTPLANKAGRDLYAFWATRVAEALDADLGGDAEPVVVNLASQEYFRVVDRASLRARVVECVFEDWKNGEYKVISFFAKKARGALARWAIRKRAKTPVALRGFDTDGYVFADAVSTADRLVFRRRA